MLCIVALLHKATYQDLTVNKPNERNEIICTTLTSSPLAAREGPGIIVVPVEVDRVTVVGQKALK